MDGKKLTIRSLIRANKDAFTKYIITLPFLILLSLGAFIYLKADFETKDKFRNRLEKKVERIADVNSNNRLDIEEMIKIYEILGLDPVNGLGSRYLSVSEMQQYLGKTGNFDPETDIYNFWDELKK